MSLRLRWLFLIDISLFLYLCWLLLLGTRVPIEDRAEERHNERRGKETKGCLQQKKQVDSSINSINLIRQQQVETSAAPLQWIQLWCLSSLPLSLSLGSTCSFPSAACDVMRSSRRSLLALAASFYLARTNKNKKNKILLVSAAAADMTD